MSSRALILGRIREALQITAPVPGSHDHGHSHAAHRPTSEEFKSWLPRVGPTPEEQFALFAKNSAELKTAFQVFDSQAELLLHLRDLSVTEGWQRVATHHTEWNDAAIEALSLPTLHTDGGYDVHELEKCDVGISGCDALVAQTGSILVSTRSAGGRVLSVLPPHHIVLARREQLVPDLTAALRRMQESYAPEYPSYCGFITGPSRTGDIERILVLGAHGPKKLTVLVW